MATALGGGQTGLPHLPADFAQKMGAALAMGLRAGGGLVPTPTTTSSSKRVEVGPLYTEDHFRACCVNT